MRARFRDLCRDAAADRLAAGGAATRYASVGAGYLLSDAEVLGALRRDGFSVASVCVVDPVYGKLDDELDVSAALSQLAAFVDAPVHAFASTKALRAAAALWPGAFARCALFANIDAALNDTDLRRTRDVVLAPGGVAVQLSNCGKTSESKAWLREAPGDGWAWGLTAAPPPPRLLRTPAGFTRRDAATAATFARRDAALTGGAPAAPDADGPDETYERGAGPAVRDLPMVGGRLACAESAQAARLRRAASRGSARLLIVVAPAAHVRAAPDVRAALVGTLRKGREVLAAASDEEGWARLAPGPETARCLLDNLVHVPGRGSSPESARARLAAGDALWMLTDGSRLGLGPLLAEAED